MTYEDLCQPLSTMPDNSEEITKQLQEHGMQHHTYIQIKPLCKAPENIVCGRYPKQPGLVWVFDAFI